MHFAAVERIPLSSSNLQIANLSRTAHRNLITFFGVVSYDSSTCLVLEYAPRGSVKDLMEKGPSMSLFRASRLAWLRDAVAGKT